MSQRLVLLTGATGYVGGRLLKQLEILGVAVWARGSAERSSEEIRSGCFPIGTGSPRVTCACIRNTHEDKP